jgi:ABC-type dipeptide/oligopeptide/nickel transport system ATPase subunit
MNELQQVSSVTAGSDIHIQGVSKVFGEGTARAFQALEEVNVDIAPGEFVSVVGPSGCGKSTLMLMVAGLLERSSGQIKVGQSMVNKPLTDVGIAFQDHLLLDFRTALDNVTLHADIRGLPKAEIEDKQAATTLKNEKIESEKLKRTIQQTKETERLTKATERETQKQTALSSAYGRVNKMLNGLRSEYRDLAIRKELGTKLTEKEEFRYTNLEKRIQTFDKALKSVDASMGMHQRNVGNYKSALSGLPGPLGMAASRTENFF